MLILALFACVTAENFVAKSDAVLCQRTAECDKGAFEGRWSDQGECRDELDGQNDDVVSCYRDNCTFDDAEANDCLKAMRTSTCDEFTSGDYASDCDNVWQDCDMVDVALCLVGAAS
jgi:hypothetical protein